MASTKRALMRDIERDLRKKARDKLRELAAKLKEARRARKERLREASERCRAERLAVRERVRALRLEALDRLRQQVLSERLAARDACTVRRSEVQASAKTSLERARGELDAERAYQADLRRIERANRVARATMPKTTKAVRRSESDDEVRANLPPDLVPLFERVKRSIKAGPRQSRTEAFLKYAEEHPGEVLEVLEDATDAMIRDLERQQREAARVAKQPARGVRRARYTPEELAAVPF
jgi:hypothetical protein